MGCVNLLDVFGERYRVGFDPAYSAKHVPRDKLDPWAMVVLCERGVVYPWGGSLLAAETEGRPVTANRLNGLDSTTTVQEGDGGFVAVSFDLADFEDVAAILKPRRRRQVSDAERERLRGLSARYGFGAQSHPSERSERAVRRAEASV